MKITRLEVVLDWECKNDKWVLEQLQVIESAFVSGSHSLLSLKIYKASLTKDNIITPFNMKRLQSLKELHITSDAYIRQKRVELTHLPA